MMRAADSYPVRIGRSVIGDPITLDLIADATHTLIVGATGSGKSVLSYGLLGAAAASPHLRVCGIDPTSLLLGPFDDRLGGDDPLIVLGNQPDRTVQVCDALIAELERRLKLLRQRGIDKLATATPSEPAWVVVLEELPAIVRSLQAADKASGSKPADRLAPRFINALERLVSEARKCAMYVLALAQRPDAEVMGGYARAQFSTRVALRMESADDYRMIFPELDRDEASAGMRFRAGMGYIRAPQFDSVQTFRADFVPTYGAYCDQVRRYTPAILQSMM